MKVESMRSEEFVRVAGAVKVFGKGPGRKTVIDNLSMSIQAGEFVSIVGPSGCGKTTLLNMIAGFVPLDSGEILVDGRPVTGPGPDRGVVFQQYAVFPWLTVRENIAFAKRLRRTSGTKREIRETIDYYLEAMGLTQFGDALPKTLSGGMKQRVAIARAYASDPAMLLMDEPFAALDAQTRESMQEILQTIQVEERKTALFITHSVEEAIFLSNRIIVLGVGGAIIREICVPFPLPRSHEARLTNEFVQLRREIEGLLHPSASPVNREFVKGKS